MEERVTLRLSAQDAAQLGELSRALGTSQSETMRLALGYLADVRHRANGEVRAILERLAAEHGSDARLEVAFEGPDVARAYVAGQEAKAVPAYPEIQGDQVRLAVGVRTSGPESPALTSLTLGRLPGDVIPGTAVSRPIADLLREVGGASN
jgi:Ribbon-helix-helix protein, copG family